METTQWKLNPELIKEFDKQIIEFIQVEMLTNRKLAGKSLDEIKTFLQTIDKEPFVEATSRYVIKAYLKTKTVKRKKSDLIFAALVPFPARF